MAFPSAFATNAFASFSALSASSSLCINTTGTFAHNFLKVVLIFAFFFSMFVVLPPPLLSDCGGLLLLASSESSSSPPFLFFASPLPLFKTSKLFSSFFFSRASVSSLSASRIIRPSSKATSKVSFDASSAHFSSDSDRVTACLTSVSSEKFFRKGEEKSVSIYYSAYYAQRERVTGRDRPRHPLRISSRPYPKR